jgi:(E)-4-hydroxy-3-methylbut-2-enyl-diphosphate synthase
VSKVINVGGFSHIRPVKIGGSLPVVIQTMYKDRLTQEDLKDGVLVKKIDALALFGCKLLRFAVPDIEAAEVLGNLAQSVSMPLVADIHFDYKIALRCMDFPVAKIRINPGNIGSREKTCAVLEKAAKNNIPVRIGVNAGSLPADIRDTPQSVNTAQALALTAEREIEILKEYGFDNFLVSMKANGDAEFNDMTVRDSVIFDSQIFTDPLYLLKETPMPITKAFNPGATASQTSNEIGNYKAVNGQYNNIAISGLKSA